MKECRCLMEIENGLERTQYCFVPCAEQIGNSALRKINQADVLKDVAEKLKDRVLFPEAVERAKNYLDKLDEQQREEKLNALIRHVKKVEDNCNVLARRIMKTDSKFAMQLIQRGRQHDVSKFNPYEFVHLNSNDKLFRSALQQHHDKNSHHPEYYGSIFEMSALDIAEMVCDCLARSQEFGTDIKKWFFEEASKKYGYNKGDIVWTQIENYLNLVLNPTFDK